MMIPGRLLVGAYNFLAFFSTRNEARIQRNLIKNKGSLENLYRSLPKLKESRYIETQSLFCDISIGRSTLDMGGCAVIAIYNVMAYFERTGEEEGEKIRVLTDLIRSFEWDGIVRKGRYGISPGAVRKQLLRLGYRADLSIISDEDDINSFGCEHDAVIVMAYNKKGSLKDQLHYIAVTKEDGLYMPHNVHGRQHPADSLYDATMQVSETGPFVICLIGINS